MSDDSRKKAASRITSKTAALLIRELLSVLQSIYL